jgi:hypothetical protein
MALARWQAPIQDAAGNVVPGATIEVRDEESGLLATLFSDRAGTVPLGNPFNADAGGFAAFFVEGGAYRIAATSGSFSFTWRYVAIGIAAEFDLVPGNSASLNVGTGAGTVAAGDDARFTDPIATAAEYRALTAARRLHTTSVKDGVVAVPLAIAAGNVAWNMNAGINFTLAMTGNATLQNPTSVIPGKSGRIRIAQDATGGRTLALGSSYKTPGGLGITLSTAANAIDYFDYDCIAANEIRIAHSKAWG